MAKFSKVVSAVTHESITGLHSSWVLTLDCGHDATAPKWKRGWRARTKPAPSRVICRECEAASIPQTQGAH